MVWGGSKDKGNNLSPATDSSEDADKVDCGSASSSGSTSPTGWGSSNTGKGDKMISASGSSGIAYVHDPNHKNNNLSNTEASNSQGNNQNSEVYTNSNTSGNDRERSASNSGSSVDWKWKFQQSFGESVRGEEILDADIISRLEFDKTGEHLASGDRGGRVVLFKRCNTDETNTLNGAGTNPSQNQPWYRYLTEFQSHEPEFDYLKSHEILEKINQVRWCHGAAGSQSLLTTNDKKVKLWKVSEQNVRFCTNFNLRESMETAVSPPSSPSPALGSPSLSPRPAAVFGLSGSMANAFCGDRATVYGERAFASPSRMQIDNSPSKSRGSTVTELKIPTSRTKEKVLSARCRRIYCNAHAYHINSIALSSDGETFISADDLTINLWHVDIPNHGYHIVNMKPPSFEELTELITSADFHPHDCSTFCYSSSKGFIRLGDLRDTAICCSSMKTFDEVVGNRSFFSEITASISDCKFSRCGRYLIARDYMTVKVWDVKMEKAPIATMKVHESLRSKLGDMYESNCIFDKFDCCVSPNGDHVATGSYSNIMRIFGMNGIDQVLECSMNPQKYNVKASPKEGSSRLGLGRLRRDSRRSSFGQGFTGELDTSAKLLHMAWHPRENILAVASTNSLFFFNSINCG